MSRDKQVVLRVTQDEKKLIQRLAAQAGHRYVSDWIRELVLGEHAESDARSSRWAAFQRQLRELLQDRPDPVLHALIVGSGHAYDAAVAAVAKHLELRRALAVQERGILLEEARAELERRLDDSLRDLHGSADSSRSTGR